MVQCKVPSHKIFQKKRIVPVQQADPERIRLRKIEIAAKERYLTELIDEIKQNRLKRKAEEPA